MTTPITSDGKRRGPEHKLSSRQQRKLDGRLSGQGFQRVYFQVHRHGTRLQRRRLIPESRGKAVVNGRAKSQKRGERYGRQLERLILCGAPLYAVQAFKLEMREHLSK